MGRSLGCRVSRAGGGIQGRCGVPALALDQRLSLGDGRDALRIEALVVPLNEPTRGLADSPRTAVILAQDLNRFEGT